MLFRKSNKAKTAKEAAAAPASDKGKASDKAKPKQTAAASASASMNFHKRFILFICPVGDSLNHFGEGPTLLR